MISKKLFTLLTICLAATWISCNDDDENSGPSTPSFPHDASFNSIEIVDFKMWTNGSEVSTEGLTLEDLIDPEEAELLSAEYYSAISPITFTADSLSNIDEVGNVESYAYNLSNDSIFIVFTNPFDPDESVESFFALGSPFDFRLVQGYTQLCINQGNSNSCTSSLAPFFFDLESGLEEQNLSGLDEIGPNDTLIVFNQFVRFR